MKPRGTPSAIAAHVQRLYACRACPHVIGPVVTSRPVVSPIYLIGQAPGPHEGALGRPFAWTAGKTLFRWFQSIGVDEETFRAHVFMAAVCRCFPGKARGGGDRVPSPAEIATCSRWMKCEFELLKPELVIPVGRLAIELFLPKSALVEVIGKKLNASAFGQRFDLIALPHPSGASTWFKMEPGRTLLGRALKLLARQAAWRELRAGSTKQKVESKK